MDYLHYLDFKKNYLKLLSVFTNYGVTYLNDHSSIEYDEQLVKFYKSMISDDKDIYLINKEKNVLKKLIAEAPAITRVKNVKSLQENNLKNNMPRILFRVEDRIATEINEPSRNHISKLNIPTRIFYELYNNNIHTIEDLKIAFVANELPTNIASNKQELMIIKNQLSYYANLNKTVTSYLNNKEINYFNTLIKELNGPKGTKYHL